jgi:hypothetical protein
MALMISLKWTRKCSVFAGRFVEPARFFAQRHDGRDASILQYGKEVYVAAKQRHPERWTGSTRDWELKDEVWLNPERNQPEELRQVA